MIISESDSFMQNHKAYFPPKRLKCLAQEFSPLVTILQGYLHEFVNHPFFNEAQFQGSGIYKVPPNRFYIEIPGSDFALYLPVICLSTGVRVAIHS